MLRFDGVIVPRTPSISKGIAGRLATSKVRPFIRFPANAPSDSVITFASGVVMAERAETMMFPLKFGVAVTASGGTPLRVTRTDVFAIETFRFTPTGFGEYWIE